MHNCNSENEHKFYYHIEESTTVCQNCIGLMKLCRVCEIIVTGKDYLFIDDKCCVCEYDFMG